MFAVELSVAASWWKRAASHVVEIVLVRTLLPINTPVLTILASIVIDLAAHGKWPGQSLGKRLFSIQMLQHESKPTLGYGLFDDSSSTGRWTSLPVRFYF